MTFSHTQTRLLTNRVGIVFSSSSLVLHRYMVLECVYIYNSYQRQFKNTIHVHRYMCSRMCVYITQIKGNSRTLYMYIVTYVLECVYIYNSYQRQFKNTIHVHRYMVLECVYI